MAKLGVTRRIFLTSGSLLFAGLTLSACHPDDRIAIELATDSTFEFFDSIQAEILLGAAELMIPRTHTAGATDTGALLYLDKLMLNWASEATRMKILGVTDILDEHAEQMHKSRYVFLSKDARFAVLQEMDETSFSQSAEAGFYAPYRLFKKLIFHIHYSSEAANPDFVLIPGQYRGDLSETDYTALIEENRY